MRLYVVPNKTVFMYMCLRVADLKDWLFIRKKPRKNVVACYLRILSTFSCFVYPETIFKLLQEHNSSKKNIYI